MWRQAKLDSLLQVVSGEVPAIPRDKSRANALGQIANDVDMTAVGTTSHQCCCVEPASDRLHLGAKPLADADSCANDRAVPIPVDNSGQRARSRDDDPLCRHVISDGACRA